MWIYLGFLAVLLILHEKNIRHDLDLARDNIYKEQNDQSMNIFTTKYKDACNNEIKVPDIYCLNRNCVLRCCNDGSDLNRDGTCAEDDYTTEFVYHPIFVYKWSEKPPKSEVVIHTKREEDLKNDEQIAEYGILQGGFLKIKLKNNTEQWLTAAPLDFCVNIHVAALMQLDRKNIAFIYKYNNVTDHTFKYVVAGMVVSLLVIGYIVFRISTVPRRIFRLDRWALILTLTAAYITTTVQLLTTRAGIVSATECRVISPFIYFFVLSIFFWLIAMSFHSWWIIRKNSTNINKEVDCAKFKRFWIFCWLFPFFITVYALFEDILQLATIYRPPFDSCLTEDVGMGVYMYIPIAILTAIRGILYEMKLYNIWRLQRSYNNIHDIAKCMISKHSYVVQIKLLVIIAVSGALQLVPNVPWIIYYTIHAYNILIGTTMLAMFVYERYTYDVPITWYNFSEKFSEVCGNPTGTATGDRNRDITVIETALDERQI